MRAMSRGYRLIYERIRASIWEQRRARRARQDAAAWTNEGRASWAGYLSPHEGERIHRRILAARSR
jgi:hypothetical protein